MAGLVTCQKDDVRGTSVAVYFVCKEKHCDKHRGSSESFLPDLLLLRSGARGTTQGLRLPERARENFISLDC